MNLLHSSLNLIYINALLVPVSCRFLCKQHSGISILGSKKRVTLCRLRHNITCGKLSQGVPPHPIVLLTVDKHLKVLYHTGIRLFCLTVHLQMKGCRHSLIDTQVAAYLMLKGWGKLQSSI